MQNSLAACSRAGRWVYTLFKNRVVGGVRGDRRRQVRCGVYFFLKEMPIKAFIHIHETIQSLAQLGHLQNLSSKGQAPM